MVETLYVGRAAASTGSERGRPHSPTEGRIPVSLTSFADQSPPLVDADRDPAQGRADSLVEPNYRSWAFVWVLAVTAVRLAFLAPVPLGNGEAYYYSWSRFLDWSYYDHPPLVAWMVRLTTAFGHSPAAVRLGPVLAAGVFGLLFYRLAERLYRPRAAFLSLVLVSALPVFVGSSFVLNPEAALAPLWVGFLLAIERMRDRDEWFRPVLAGALLGLAFLAKYTALLLVPAALLYLVLSPSTHRWLRRPALYTGGGLALLIAMPVVAWNQDRGWPSVRLHLLERASVAVPAAGENTLNHLVEISSTRGTSLVDSLLRVGVGQLMSYSPLLAPWLVIGLVACLRRARSDDRDLFLSVFSWPILLVLLAAMIEFKDAEQHWTMMALVPAAIAAGHFADERWSRARVVRVLGIAGVSLSGLVFVIACIHVRSTAILRFIPGEHYDAKADITNELIGWDRVRASLTRAAARAPGAVVLASNHYSVCGRMFFEMQDEPPIYCPTAKRSAFDFFGRKTPPSDATVIALTTDIHQDLPAGLRDRSCALSDEVDVERAGRRVARYFVHTCPSAPFDSNARASR
jgi:hypothetical protein